MLKIRNPEAPGISDETPHFIETDFAFSDIFLLSISKASKDPQREKEATRKAANYAQAGPSSSKLSKHPPCSRNATWAFRTRYPPAPTSATSRKFEGKLL